MKYLTLLACVAAAVSASGSEPSPLVKEGQAIRRLVADQAETWNRGDWKAYAALHSEDFDGIAASGDVVDRNSAARAASSVKMSAAVKQIRFVRPDVAMVDAVYALNGGASQGRKTLLVEKREGAWVIVAERASLLP